MTTNYQSQLTVITVVESLGFLSHASVTGKNRYVWSSASVLFIDENPRDGLMDDLNKDGKIDRNDAHWLANFINEMSQRGVFDKRIGGLGVYGANAAHEPFVHVDVRGERARW